MRVSIIFLSLLTLYGCATSSLRPIAFDSGATIKLPAERQVVVTVRNAPVHTAQNAGSTAKVYDATGRYQVAPSALRDAAALAQQYRLRQVAAWPIELLDVHCIVFAVGGDRTIESVLEALAQDPRVESAQGLRTFTTRGSRNYDDPYAGLQDNLSKMQVGVAHQWSTGKGVRIAVVDSGIDIGHPDLLGRVAMFRDLTGLPDGVRQTETHGLAVAGIIAAAAGNGEGIVGVAPEAKILALRACWQTMEPDGTAASRCNTFTLAQAIAVAITYRADVINLSLTGPHDPLLERLLRRAMSMGKIVVSALPEQESQDEAFPASLPGVLAVRTAEVPATRSAPADALPAPGRRILTLRPHGSYDFGNGSSLAAANVSGVVALLLAVRSSLSADEIRALLTGFSAHSVLDPLPHTPMINACAALATLLRRGECDTGPRQHHAEARKSRVHAVKETLAD